MPVYNLNARRRQNKVIYHWVAFKFQVRLYNNNNKNLLLLLAFLVNSPHSTLPYIFNCSNERDKYLKTNNQSKDFIDEILNLDSGSLDEALRLEKFLADDSILIKQEPEELSMAEVRDRQKKDNHNMSEYWVTVQ